MWERKTHKVNKRTVSVTPDGDCAFNVELKFDVVLGKKKAENTGSTPGSDRAKEITKNAAAMVMRAFRKLIGDTEKSFVNPPKGLPLPPCCWFHLGIKLRVRHDLAGMYDPASPKGSRRALLAQAESVIVVDQIGGQNPHADIGGRFVVLDEDNLQASATPQKRTLLHELGHILGLDDAYPIPHDIPSLGVKANGMTQDEGKDHENELMGEKNAQHGVLSQAEIAQIIKNINASNLGVKMECDRQKCCPIEHPDPRTGKRAKS